jgi:hypothetical protein
MRTLVWKHGKTPFHTKEYLLAKIKIDERTQCWNWVGQKDKDGYGQYRTCSHSKWTKAHKEAHELFIGPIPKNYSVLHRCDNKQCINPAHLYSGTQAQNVKDMIERGNPMYWRPEVWQKRTATILAKKGSKNVSMGNV